MDQTIPSATPSSVIKKRSKVSRACDECRRKKIKCDAIFNNATNQLLKSCSHCIKIQESCSFERQPLKRGPTKGFFKNNSSNNGLPLSMFSNSSASSINSSAAATANIPTKGISKCSSSSSNNSSSSANSNSPIHASNVSYFTRHLQSSISPENPHPPMNSSQPSYTMQQQQPSHLTLPPINTITSPSNTNSPHSLLQSSDSALRHHHHPNLFHSNNRIASGVSSPVMFNNNNGISSASPLPSPGSATALNTNNNNASIFNFSTNSSNNASASPSTSSPSPSPFFPGSNVPAPTTAPIVTAPVYQSQQHVGANTNTGPKSSFLSSILNDNSPSVSSTQSFVPSFNPQASKNNGVNNNGNSSNKNNNNNNNSTQNSIFWKATNTSNNNSQQQQQQNLLSFAHPKTGSSISLQSDPQQQQFTKIGTGLGGAPYFSSRSNSVDSVNSFASSIDYASKPLNFPIISGIPPSVGSSNSIASSASQPLPIPTLQPQQQSITSNVPSNGARSFNEQLDDNLLFYYKTIHPNLPIMPLQRFQFDLLVNQIPNTPENRLVLNLFTRALHILVCVVAKEDLNSIFAPNAIPTNIADSGIPIPSTKDSSSKPANKNGNVNTDSSSANGNNSCIKKLMLIKDILHPLFIQFFQLYPNWTKNSDNDHLNLLLLMALNLMNYTVVNSSEDVSISFSCTLTVLSHLRLDVRVKNFIEEYQKNLKTETNKNFKEQDLSSASSVMMVDTNGNKINNTENSRTSASSSNNARNMDKINSSQVHEISLMYTRSLMASVILDSIFSVSFGTVPMLRSIIFDYHIVDTYLFSSLFLDLPSHSNPSSPKQPQHQPVSSSGSSQTSISSPLPILKSAINHFKFGLLFSSEIYPLLIDNDIIISFDNLEIRSNHSNPSNLSSSSLSFNSGSNIPINDQNLCAVVYKLKEFVNETQLSRNMKNDSQSSNDDLSTCLAQSLADFCEFMLAISHLRTTFSQENVTSLSLISLKKNITDYQLKLLLRIKFETLPMIIAALKSIVTNTANTTSNDANNTGKSLSFISSSSLTNNKNVIIQSPWIPVFFKYIIRYLNIIQIVVESSKFNYESMKYAEPELQSYLQNIQSTIQSIFQEYLPLIQPFNDANDYGISNSEKINNNFKFDITNTLGSSSSTSNNPIFIQDSSLSLTSSNLHLNTSLATNSVSASSFSLPATSLPSMASPSQSYPMFPNSPSNASSYSAGFSSSNNNTNNSDTVMSQDPQVVGLSSPSRISSNQQTYSSGSANHHNNELHHNDDSRFLNSRALSYFLTLQRSTELNGVIEYSIRSDFVSSSSARYSYNSSAASSLMWTPRATSPSTSSSYQFTSDGQIYSDENNISGTNTNNGGLRSDGNADVDIIRNFGMWKSLMFDIEAYLNIRNSEGWIFY